MLMPAPSLGTVAPGLPQPVIQLVDGALGYEREQRYTDARVMQRAVREAYHATMGSAPLVAPRPSMPDAYEVTSSSAATQTVRLPRSPPKPTCDPFKRCK